MKISCHVELLAAVIVLLVVAASDASTAQESDPPNRYIVESRIYSFTAREYRVWQNGHIFLYSSKADSSVDSSRNSTLNVAANARIEAGPIKITLDGGVLHIKGDESTGLKLLAQPKMAVLENQKAEVTIRGHAPIQYFEPAWGQLTDRPEAPVPNDSDANGAEGALNQVVDLDFNEMDLRNVVELLAKKGEINVVIRPELAKGKTVTAALKNIPLGRALEVILEINDLKLLERNDVYEVVSRDEAQQPAHQASKLFVLRESEKNPGLSLSIVVHGTDEDDRLTGTSTLSISVLDDREPVPGVTLSVGKPTITTQTTRHKLAVSPGDWSGLLITENEVNHVLALLRISPYTDQSELEESRNRDDDEAELKEYAVRVLIIRYDGSLDKKRLNVLKSNPANKTSNENVLKLTDGIIPLKWRPVNLKEENGLSRLDARKSLELVSAPRITLMTKDAMLRRGTSLKMLVASGSDAHKDDFYSMLMEKTESHHGVLTGEDFVGKGLVADIHEIQYPSIKRQLLKEGHIEVTSTREIFTGFLLLMGVEETETEGEIAVDLFTQIRTRNHESRSVSSIEETLERAVKVTAFRDRAILSEGQPEIYLASVSKSEYYIILVEANTVTPGGRRAN